MRCDNNTSVHNQLFPLNPSLIHNLRGGASSSDMPLATDRWRLIAPVIITASGCSKDLGIPTSVAAIIAGTSLTNLTNTHTAEVGMDAVQYHCRLLLTRNKISLKLI